MKLIYIAGPYRADTGIDVHRNILDAAELAIKVWELGMVAITPHLNTFLFDYYAKHIDDLGRWLAGDLEILSRCDGILMTPFWRESSGAMQEREFALIHGICIYYSLKELEDDSLQNRSNQG